MKKTIILVFVMFFLQINVVLAQTPTSSPTVTPKVSPSVVEVTPSKIEGEVIKEEVDLRKEDSKQQEEKEKADDNSSLKSEPVVNHDPQPCRVTLTVESGVYSAYHDENMSEFFHNGGVANVNKYLDICPNRKVSYFVNNWAQVGLNDNFPIGAENDLTGGINFAATENLFLSFEAGTFFLEGGSINLFRGSIVYETLLSKDGATTIGVENSVSYYEPSKSMQTKGGIVNHLSVPIARAFRDDKFRLEVTPFASLDNNLFDLGDKKPLSMLGLKQNFLGP